MREGPSENKELLFNAIDTAIKAIHPQFKYTDIDEALIKEVCQNPEVKKEIHEMIKQILDLLRYAAYP